MAINAFDVTINAQGKLDMGLYGFSVDGFGILSFGDFWSCGAIWDVGDNPITTLWADCGTPSNIEECVD